MLQLDRRILIHFDYLTPILLAPIVLTSCILIGEINDSLLKKELTYIVIGIFGFVCVLFVFMKLKRRKK